MEISGNAQQAQYLMASKLYRNLCLFSRFCLAGGGVALLYASRELDKIPTENFDQKIGVQIIQNALKVNNCRPKL